MTVDIDLLHPPHEDVAHPVILELYDFALPPNLIIMDRETGKMHALWELDNPVWFDPNKPWPRPVKLLKAVQSGLAKEFRHVGADRSSNGFLVKNPFHPRHEVQSLREQPYRLSDFVGHIDLSYSTVNDDGQGRNRSLFNALVRWAKIHRDEFSDLGRFEMALLGEAHDLNQQFDVALPQAEVRSTTRSVARYVWTRWDGRRRGVLTFDPACSIGERQRQGGLHVSNLRRTRTVDRLNAAYIALSATGACTQQALADASGVSLRSVKRYWHVVVGSATVKVATGVRENVTPQYQVRSLRSLRAYVRHDPTVLWQSQESDALLAA
ncbi:hypothetical protein [Azospirillum melinis]